MISLIITVLNEKNNLSTWFSDIQKQTLSPDEIIIVDGGSTDGTWEWLQMQAQQHQGLHVFQELGNISQGRNAAIQYAHGDIIVVTDAGCTYDSTWFQKITDPFVSQDASFVATAFGPWFKKNDSVMTYLIASATTPAPHEFRKDWLPSSRSVAFTKKLWQNVGGYPEWIPICEDIIFDKKVSRIAGSPYLVREPLVFWRPRKNLAHYFKQLFRYTKSDGHGKLNLLRQWIRYGVYSGVIILILLSVMSTSLYLVLLCVGSIIYIKKFWIRWFQFTKQKSYIYRVTGAIAIPFVVAYGDVAKMCGWPVGVFERWTKKITFEHY